MGDRKHIDRLFQERFKDFEAKPDDAIWENIEAKLNEKKKKRRLIPIWWRYAGVAALLVLALTLGSKYFGNDNTEITPQVVDIENNDLQNTKEIEHQDLSNHDATESVIANVEKDNEDSKASSNPSQQNSDKQLNLNKQSTSIANSNNLNDTEESETIYKNNSSVKNNVITKTTQEQKDNVVIADNSNIKTDKSEKVSTSNKNNTTSNALFKNEDSKNIAENKTSDTSKNISKNNSSVKNDVITNSKTPQEKKGNVVVADNSIIKTDKINNTSKAKKVVEIAENNPKKETQTIEEAIEKNESLLEEDDDTNVALNKWGIAPNAAPVYFSSLGKGSSIDQQFNNNSKSGEVNMSYGLNASYAINSRVTIRSGINRVNLGYNTNDVIVFQSVNASAANAKTLQTISSSASDEVVPTNTVGTGNNITVVSAEAFKSNNNIAAFSTSNTTINQSFGYIEIPLEIQYALSTKRFGVNVIGGFSSLFLNNNDMFSDVEGQRINLGEADNINKTSYSANFGLGLNYKVSKKINLNLEPMFKYQMNTFKNTSGDFQPFFIGVYTGFGIKF